MAPPSSSAPAAAYSILAWDLEGTEVCDWLNSLGVTGVLLKYRVPKRAGLEKHTAALQDVQRALGIVRSRAAGMASQPHAHRRARLLRRRPSRRRREQ